MVDDTTQSVAALAALAHADRLRAFRLLVRAGPSGLASGAIADALAVPPTRMSFHLAALERSGLVRSWRDGRNIRYAVEFQAMRGLLVYLTEECCDGHPEICGDIATIAQCGCGPPSGVTKDESAKAKPTAGRATRRVRGKV